MLVLLIGVDKKADVFNEYIQLRANINEGEKASIKVRAVIVDRSREADAFN